MFGFSSGLYFFSTFTVIVMSMPHALSATSATPGSANLILSLKVVLAESFLLVDDATTALAKSTGSFLSML